MYDIDDIIAMFIIGLFVGSGELLGALFIFIAYKCLYTRNVEGD